MESSDKRSAANSDNAADEPTERDQIEQPTEAQQVRLPLSRRAALASVLGIGGLNLLSSSVQADHEGPHWNKDVDADGKRLFDLGALAMSRTGTDITAFNGKYLSVETDGTLTAAHNHLGETWVSQELQEGLRVQVEGKEAEAIIGDKPSKTGVGVRGIGAKGVVGQSGDGGTGVMGEGQGTDGVGVKGTNSADTGRGVVGEGTGTGGVGVEGRGDEGVRGQSDADAGTGVCGETTGIGGIGVEGLGEKGVRGSSETDGGTGVEGLGEEGVRGQSDADAGTGVCGENTGTGGVGVEGTGQTGVRGEGDGRGVFGTGFNGVWGEGDFFGVRGVGSRGVRGDGRGTPNIGVEGRGRRGVVGRNLLGDGFGVDGDGMTGVRGRGTDIGVFGDTTSEDSEWGLYTPVDTFVGNVLHVEGNAKVLGDLDVDGAKNFTQAVETDFGERQVAYTAVEAPNARTEASGTARLRDGRATVDLPDHFDWVTSEAESLVVQVTPYGGDGRLIVSERSTERLVIDDPDDPEADYEFAYTVKGVREGFEDKPVVREPTL